MLSKLLPLHNSGYRPLCGHSTARVAFSLLLLFLIPLGISAQSLSVVVPAISNYDPSDRDAHFNWEFESSGGGNVQIGQFACGSYWVAPANGDSGVKVLSLTGKTDDPNWHDLVSCDADPIPENMGLLDGSNGYGNYNASENIIPNLPLTYTPNAGSCISLVAAMQRNETETSKAGTALIEGEAADAYCVVTILPTVPANGGSDMIRPNITGTTKELITWDDFDLTRLPSYAFISGKTTQQWEDSRVKWSHSIEIFGGFDVETSPGNSWSYFSEGGRAFRAQIVIPNYGAHMAQAFNNDLLALFSSANTLVEKKPALAAILAFGLDLYHARYDYGTGLRKAWRSGAGQAHGRFLPTVFLASLLEDESKAHVLRNVAIHNHDLDPALLGPQELRQIKRGVTGVLLWGDGPPYFRSGNNITQEEKSYWSNLETGSCFDSAINVCEGTDGGKGQADPYGYIDGPPLGPGGYYMSTAFGGFRAIAAAMILMPEIRSIVNTDAPIEYVDRAIRHGRWAYPDPVAPPSSTDQLNSCDVWNALENCTEWGSTWGPDPSDIRFAIENGVGRFHSYHGNTVDTGAYESSRASSNWSSIIALYDGNTYEDNIVAIGEVVAPEIIFETGYSPKAFISCATLDAEIRYTVNGTDPTTSSPLYTGPIYVGANTEVRAKAYYTGMTASEIRSNTFDFNIPTDFNIPSTPTGLTASNITQTTVDLDWNTASDDISILGYRVYTNGGNPIFVTDTSVTVSGLIEDTQYTFKVTALDLAENESSLSNGASVITLPIPTVYEAENATSFSGCSVSSAYSGYTGSGYMDFGGNGTWIEWNNVDGGYGGTVTLEFHYSVSGSSARPCAVIVNGVNIGNANFIGTNGWGNWSTVTVDATLLEGTNTIRLTANTSAGGPNVDNMGVPISIHGGGGSSDVDAPTIPTGLTASNPTLSTIDLDWNASSDNVGVTGYNVYINSSPTDVGNNTSITLSGLSSVTTYNFTVSAYDAANNESSQSSSVQATTTSSGGGGDPSIVNVTASAEDGSNVAANTLDSNTSTRWSAAGDPQWIQFEFNEESTLSSVDIAFYNGNSRNYYFDIQVSTDGTNWTTVFSGQSSGSSNALESFDTTDASALYIRYLGHGNSDNTWNSLTEIEFSASINGDTIAPSVPGNLSTSNLTETSVDLDWNASSDNVAVTGYNVYINGANPVPVTSNSATITGLIAGTSYTFTVTAVDAADNESEASSGLQITTDDSTAPNAPTGLTEISTTASSASISWSASSDNVGVIAYNVYTNGTNPIQVTGTTVSLYGLSSNTTYTFTVTAIDAANNESSTSSELEVTTDFASGPPSIVNVTASNEDGSNVAANTLDSNTSTRWSAAGDPQWIQFEFNEESTLSSIDIAFYNGNSRNYYFDIQVSTDGTNWTTLFSGQSSGSSNALESFDTTDASALYVRYLGHGNSANTWNSLTEIEFSASINGDTIAPSIPSGITEVSTTATSSNISWTASSDNVGVVAYNVYTNGANPIQATGTSVVISGLSPEANYTFTVTAVDAEDNESSASSAVQITTKANGNGAIVNTSASAEDGTNVVGNVLDGNTSTRWAAAGDPQWIQFDLNGTYTLQWIDIAFYNGSSRSSYFDVQVSSDGTNWTTVYSGQSSGSSNTLESFDVTDTTASYIRYLGHGNSSNSWNSLTEIELGF